MRAVIQRVSRASVSVERETVGEIGVGVVALIGVASGDADADARWMADKIRSLRIFPDERGVMDRSLEEAGGAVLAISQFTLLGDARRGRRPGYTAAAPPEEADRLYTTVIDHLRAGGVHVEQGRFRAHMHVDLVNDGPVTILLDSTKTF